MLSLFDSFQTVFKKHILLKSKTCKLTSEIGKVNSGIFLFYNLSVHNSPFESSHVCTSF